MRIGIDLDGADASALELLEWSLLWSQERQFFGEPRAEASLGNKHEIHFFSEMNLRAESLVKKKTFVDLSAPSYHCHHCGTAISAELSARESLKSGDGSSLAQAMLKLAAGELNCLVTGGNTGALALLANRHLRRIDEAHRPAFCALLPGTSPTLMLDLGANLESNEATLESYARLGMGFAESARISALSDHPVSGFALLNIGTEGHKGTRSLQAAHEFFSAHQDQLLRSQYRGFVEASQLFDNDVEVIVTDGFTGNIALKSAEGAARFLLKSEGLLQGEGLSQGEGLLKYPSIALSHGHGRDREPVHRADAGAIETNPYNAGQVTTGLAPLGRAKAGRQAEMRPPRKAAGLQMNGAFLLGYQQHLIKAHGASTGDDFGSALDLAAFASRL